MDPVERLALLCDPGSLHELGASAVAGPVGVVAGRGTVEGRPVVCYAHDSRLAGGSVGTAEAETVVRALRLARDERIPLVAFLESAGARLQEGAAALGGFGRIFYENVWLTGEAPQISVVTGTSAGGGCYSPALTDFIVMTDPSAMFLTGPKVVREAIGEEISAEDLGGPGVHERNGVCHFLVPDDHGAATLVRDLLGYLSDSPGARGGGRFNGSSPDPGERVPDSPRKVYDIRDVVRDVADDGEFLEVAPRWAQNIVVGFGRLDGQAVGFVANQPRHLAGVIDVAASEKGATFVNTCRRFDLPLIVLVDTPGFMPGSSQESAGIIRHGAQLVRAFAGATVPRLTVVLRKAYGGAYITMNAKDLGADAAMAWSNAEIGVMGPRAAIQIIHRRELARAGGAEDVAERLAADYAASHIAARRALELGLLDAVIEPWETRRRLIAALRRARAQRAAAAVERRAAAPLYA